MSIIYIGNGKWRELGSNNPVQRAYETDGWRSERFKVVRGGFVAQPNKHPPTDKKHRYGNHSLVHLLQAPAFTQAMLRQCMIAIASACGIPFRIVEDGEVLFGHYRDGACWNCPNKHWRI